MSNIPPIISSQKSTPYLNENRTRKINRSDLSTNQEIFPSIQPDLNGMKKDNLVLKNSLEKYGVSEESCETLQKIMQSTQTGGNFSVLQNLLHYLHSQCFLLKNSLRIESLQKAFKTFQEVFSIASYYTFLFPTVYFLDCNPLDEKGECEVIKKIDKLLNYLKIMKKEVDSDEYKNFVINSFQTNIKGDHQKRYEAIRDEALKPLEEIGKTCQCVKELFLKIPKDDSMSFFFDDRLDNSKHYVREEFIKFKESLLGILDSYKNLMEWISPKPHYSHAFDVLMKINEIKNGNSSAILEQLFSLSNIWNKIDETTKLSSEVSSESFAFHTTFRNFLETFIHISTNDKLKNYDFQIAQIPSIDLNVIWKKLSLSHEENTPKLVSILTQDFYEELSPLKMSKDCSIKVQNCLNVINDLVTLASKSDLIHSLNLFVHSDPKSIFALGRLKENLHDLKDAIAHFEKLMKSCNAAFQKELEISTLTAEESYLLEQKIQIFKADISQILSPILKLPSVLNSLVVNAKRTKISNKQTTYQPDLEDDIRQLFNVKFKKYAEKIEEKEIKQEPLPLPIVEEITPKEPVVTPMKMQKVKAVKNETDRPKTTRRDIILAYLAEKGWEQASMNSAHLKLKKENESLIIPVHKSQDRLPKGTVGAIYRELSEKEEKIAARKAT